MAGMAPAAGLPGMDKQCCVTDGYGEDNSMLGALPAHLKGHYLQLISTVPSGVFANNCGVFASWNGCEREPNGTARCYQRPHRQLWPTRLERRLHLRQYKIRLRLATIILQIWIFPLCRRVLILGICRIFRHFLL